MQQKILVVGSGGREHALCWKLAQSNKVAQIFCAPGNGGTASEQKTENIAIPVSDFNALMAFAKKHSIDLTVIGPDNPLADGIVDAFEAEGLRVFGPRQAAAKLESSKVFAKQFMQQNQLPTARFAVFDTEAPALAFCRENDWARVIKVDGLALGKGVYVCDSVEECEQALKEIFGTGRFGASASQVVVEERLYGPEISLMVLSDGKTLRPMASSQDYKRRFDGNKGPNTGGMGSYSPAPIYEPYAEAIQQEVIAPLEVALQQAPFEFKGLLYVGVLIHDNKPYILEFNARFGDPETQCLLPRLESDLVDLFNACIDGTLADATMEWTANSAVCVVLTAGSYPESGAKGLPITLKPMPESVVLFHAGTQLQSDQLEAHGGRVLNIVGLGETLEGAASKAYDAIQFVRFDGMAFRRDIAQGVSLCLSS